ncbi:MAG: hypothetical protein H0T86_10905, partial [Gemmatimonadales bacterium]|nr:hypothetical protein [Gemmatimonadales bacterium]
MPVPSLVCRDAFSLAVGLLLLGRTAGAQEPDTARIVTTRLADGVYVLMGGGGNIGLSTG